jgi:hypothetical protein
MTNQRGKDAAGISGTSMVDDGGCEDDDSKPSPMTSSSLIGLGPCQEVVQAKKTTTSADIPIGWIRVKFEPDC